MQTPSEQPKMSAHAKRRLQKKMKKEQGDKEVITDDIQQNNSDGQAKPLFEARQVKTRANEQPENNDKKSNHSMKDESYPKEEEKNTGNHASKTTLKAQQKEKDAKPSKGEKKGNGKDIKKNGPGAQKVFLPPRFQDKEKVIKSTESGFTGPSDGWFDEARYTKPKNMANFDEAGKHDYYYNSYSSHHIHEEMLKDTSRTLAYQRAIEGNPEDFKGKVVLDIGCGTGILSIFAARAGAKHVYAIDNAEIALFAREIVKDNGFGDKITVIKGKIEEVELPFGPGEIDIIISEWMGYFLLYESMLDCVIDARDKYLRPGGKMLPDKAQIYVAAIEDSEYMGEKTSFWKDVYGVNMSVMSNGVFTDPMVDTVPANNIMSDQCCILDLDLMRMKKDDVEFSSFYSLRMNYNDKVHAIVSWFDTLFSDLTRPVILTTSPMKKYTHWKQSVFYIDTPLNVRKGDVLYGSIASRRDRTNFRELNIKVSYHMDATQQKINSDQQYKFK